MVAQTVCKNYCLIRKKTFLEIAVGTSGGRGAVRYKQIHLLLSFGSPVGVD